MTSNTQAVINIYDGLIEDALRAGRVNAVSDLIQERDEYIRSGTLPANDKQQLKPIERVTTRGRWKAIT